MWSLNLFRSVEDAKIEARGGLLQALIPQTAPKQRKSDVHVECSKTKELRCSCLEFKPCQPECEVATGNIQRGKNY